MENHNIQLLLKALDQSGISSIKRTISGIISIINDPDATAKDLKDIIETDPPLAMNILKIANSAYYRPVQKINQIEEAIIRIGFDSLKNIALCQKICEIFNNNKVYKGYSRNSLWKHSVAVALLGKMIFRMEFRERGDNIYTAGLLHEIGLITEDQFLYDDFKRILDISSDKKINLPETESRILGFHHAELGKEIAVHWNLPDELCMAIGFHHHPEEAPEDTLKLVTTLYVADTICQKMEIGYCDTPNNDEETLDSCLDHLCIKPYAMELIVEEMMAELTSIKGKGLL